MRKTKNSIFLIVIPLIIVAAALYMVPSINDSVNFRIEQVRIRLRNVLFPPESAVFVPNAPAQTIMTLTPAPSETPSAMATYYEAATPTATLTPTPLPDQVNVTGGQYVTQHGIARNMCAPATLAMELSYFGPTIPMIDIASVVKPFDLDYNVMPYELADYVAQNTGLQVLVRSGGDVETLKKLTAAGFPVMIEKGAYMVDISGVNSWMGHYGVVSGFDDAKGQFVTQDAYYQPDLMIDYTVLESDWRSFNFTFLVTYTSDKEAELMAALGPLADEQAAFQAAFDKASEETVALTGVDQYFAWYNRGTSQVNLQDYAGAAASYDTAFQLYETLPKERRPWRMVWYQTGPYFAYFYSGRYQDVVDLATLTLDNANNPYFEESYYWRAKANLVIGNRDQAIADLQKSLKYHPGFTPSLSELAAQGVAPE
ncbi:MAG: C39 family peptidase [Anaerolineaceae bacterium]